MHISFTTYYKTIKYCYSSTTRKKEIGSIIGVVAVVVVVVNA